LLDNGTIVASIAVSSPTERFARSRGDLTAAVVGVIDGVRSGRFG
jgi:hypothetical protein